MSDYYTHPMYDAWKLDSPDESDHDDELCQCEGCACYFDDEDLFDGYCHLCEQDLLNQEEREAEEAALETQFCKNCLALTPVDHDACSLCREPYKL